MTGVELAASCGLALFGVMCSAFFSGTETGIYTVNRLRLAVRAGHGEPAAAALRHEIAHPNRLLATLLIGNNLANYLGSIGIAIILEGMGLGDWTTIALNALVLTPILFVFGEVLPKDLFRTNADSWTYRVIRPLIGVRWLFTVTGFVPLVRGVGSIAGKLLGADADRPALARLRIGRLLREGVGAGVLSEPQVALVDRALRMHMRRVSSEMVPWERVERITQSAHGEERERILRRTPYTRLPVIDEEGDVVGVLSTMDAVLEPQQSIAELMYPRLDLPIDLPVAAALKRMRDAHRKFAIAVDPEDGRVRGIVTLKDLVEPLTGELAAW